MTTTRIGLGQEKDGASALGEEDRQQLAGKYVAIVHPAWHSCGSFKVFAAQARAYRELGAQVISIALADAPVISRERKSKAYALLAEGFEAHARIFTGMPIRKIAKSEFLRAGMLWLRGNEARMRLQIAELTDFQPVAGSAGRLDLIHCNHFFSMPIAEKLRAANGCPVVLDTHDLQARQFVLRNSRRVRLPPAAKYEDMLALELKAMCGADLLIHLNAEESEEFKGLLPQKKHALLYPAVERMPAWHGGGDPIIVASANHANFLSLVWFLKEVLPLVRDVPVRILGNIDRAVRLGAPRLYNSYSNLFLGNAGRAKLAEAYRTSAAVLLPTTEGHGISIKTIEALSCGAPLIATPLAFRGFSINPASVPNVTLVEDAKEFACAVRAAYAAGQSPAFSGASSATRQFYERYFSEDAYRQSLWAILRENLGFERGEPAPLQTSAAGN